MPVYACLIRCSSCHVDYIPFPSSRKFSTTGSMMLFISSKDGSTGPGIAIRNTVSSRKKWILRGLLHNVRYMPPVECDNFSTAWNLATILITQQTVKNDIPVNVHLSYETKRERYKSLMQLMDIYILDSPFTSTTAL